MGKNKTALILSPHVDDETLGCGGTIRKLTRDGYDVVVSAFSATREKEKLISEFHKAMKVLGVKKNIVWNYKTREFSDFRQAILDSMIVLRDEHSPNLVICPSSTDTHQDHMVICQEAFRAFKRTSIIGYECLHNCKSLSTAVFVELTRDDIEKKIEAISCYESQEHRAYTDKEVVFGAAKYHGAAIGVEFAEVFECIRMVNFI